MNIIGTWKAKKVGAFDIDQGLVMKSVDEIMAMDDSEEALELKEMARTLLNITNDGNISMYVEDPSKKSGKSRLMKVEEFPWKEEDGEFFCDTGDECEIDGEPVDSWMPLEFSEDGLLIFAEGMLLLEKED